MPFNEGSEHYHIKHLTEYSTDILLPLIAILSFYVTVTIKCTSKVIPAKPTTVFINVIMIMSWLDKLIQ